MVGIELWDSGKTSDINDLRAGKCDLTQWDNFLSKLVVNHLSTGAVDSGKTAKDANEPGYTSNVLVVSKISKGKHQEQNSYRNNDAYLQIVWYSMLEVK